MNRTSDYDKITSRNNVIIKQAAKLNKSAKFRRESRQFFIEGVRICRDALLSGIEIDTVLFTSRIKDKFPEVLEQFANIGSAQIYEISEDAAQKLADTSTAQGLFCICSMPENPPSLDNISNNGRYIMLENISDPSNLGAIIRTAEALGITGAVLSADCCDLYNPKTLRASMGSVFRFPTVIADDFIAQIDAFNKRGILTAASVPDSSAVKVTELDFSNGCAVIIGNEGNGITQEAKAACSVCTTIPMLGRAESLNASMAAAIIMWEMLK